MENLSALSNLPKVFIFLSNPMNMEILSDIRKSAFLDIA